MSTMFVALSVLILAIQSVSAKEICVEGYIMDFFCIDRGTLFDNNAVVTLENPEVHSVHCLVDVSQCVSSGYNVLLPNPGGSPKYAYAFKLDQFGNNLVIKHARSTGRKGGCSSCSGSGIVTRGYRATIFGKMLKSSNGEVPILAVTNVTTSPKLLNSSATWDGCPANSSKSNFTLFTESGGQKTPSIAHGSLMIIGWGFLLPTGVASAHFLKHRPNALWFKAHRIIQVFGLIVAICGWAVALGYFDVFTAGASVSFTHGALGMTVMVLGILQPLNALIRPHPGKEGEPRPFKRLLWEIVHKCSGYIAIVLAAVTICYGTYVVFGHQTIFRAAWGVTIAWVVLFSLACAWDGYRYKKCNMQIDNSVKLENK